MCAYPTSEYVAALREESRREELVNQICYHKLYAKLKYMYPNGSHELAMKDSKDDVTQLEYTLDLTT